MNQEINDNYKDSLKAVEKIYKRTFKVIWLVVSIVVITILGTIFLIAIPSNVGFWLALICWISDIGLGISILILDIINAIKIMTTDFNNKEINNIRIVWGIFTIIILGWIASLIFSITAKNKLKNLIE